MKKKVKTKTGALPSSAGFPGTDKIKEQEEVNQVMMSLGEAFGMAIGEVYYGDKDYYKKNNGKVEIIKHENFGQQ